MKLRLRKSGWLATRAISAWSLAAIGFGVPGGATSPK
jgi:hypothetical protein